MLESNKKNNPTLGLSVLAVAALLCIVLPWGSFVATSGMPGMEMEMSGTNGHFTVIGIKMPNWFIALLSAGGMVTAILRIRSVITLPKLVPILILLFAGVFSIAGAVVLITNGTLGPGIILINLATIGGLVFTISTPVARE